MEKMSMIFFSFSIFCKCSLSLWDCLGNKGERYKKKRKCYLSFWKKNVREKRNKSICWIFGKRRDHIIQDSPHLHAKIETKIGEESTMVISLDDPVIASKMSFPNTNLGFIFSHLVLQVAMKQRYCSWFNVLILTAWHSLDCLPGFIHRWQKIKKWNLERLWKCLVFPHLFFSWAQLQRCLKLLKAESSLEESLVSLSTQKCQNGCCSSIDRKKTLKTL